MFMQILGLTVTLPWMLYCPENAPQSTWTPSEIGELIGRRIVQMTYWLPRVDQTGSIANSEAGN